MALTVSDVDSAPFPIVGGRGNMQLSIKDVAFDSSYPTGGEALTANDLGFGSGGSVIFVDAEPRGGYLFDYDYTASKLIARYGDLDAGADGPAIQVPNTTSLAAVTGVRVIAIGTVG